MSRKAASLASCAILLLATMTFVPAGARAQSDDNPLLNGSGYKPHTDSTFGASEASESPQASAPRRAARTVSATGKSHRRTSAKRPTHKSAKHAATRRKARSHAAAHRHAAVRTPRHRAASHHRKHGG